MLNAKLLLLFLFSSPWICILGSIGTSARSEFWKLLICQVTPTQTDLGFDSRVGLVAWSSAAAVGALPFLWWEMERRESLRLVRAVMRFCSL